MRDHLANERTQLAWLRTSANVVVVGLAVARFADGGEVTAASLVAGGVLILVGAVGVGYGTLRYRRADAAIRRGDIEGGQRQPRARPWRRWCCWWPCSSRPSSCCCSA